jgi:hypothetical protein
VNLYELIENSRYSPSTLPIFCGILILSSASKGANHTEGPPVVIPIHTILKNREMSPEK